MAQIFFWQDIQLLKTVTNKGTTAKLSGIPGAVLNRGTEVMVSLGKASGTRLCCRKALPGPKSRLLSDTQK